MTNKISSASQTVRAFNVGTLGDCSAWDDNLDAATLEWLLQRKRPVSCPARAAMRSAKAASVLLESERDAACALLDLMPWVFGTVIRSSSKA